MTIVGENLSFRLRKLLFEKMLRMNVGWHDLPVNNSGKLTTIISTDT